MEIRQRIVRTQIAKTLNLDVVSYRFEPEKHNVPVNAAIAKANTKIHDMEIEILSNMVQSDALEPDQMLAVDGPLQFIRQDTGKPELADMFYNVVGISKSFNPMLPTSNKAKRGGTQIGAELLKLEYGERTPVFLKENDRRRRFGVWYLRIRPKNRVSNPLEGIIKIEKMALEDYYDSGIPTDVIDTISLSLLNEGSPTCCGSQGRVLHFLLAQTEDVFQKDIEDEYSLRPPTATELLKKWNKAASFAGRLHRKMPREKELLSMKRHYSAKMLSWRILSIWKMN